MNNKYGNKLDLHPCYCDEAHFTRYRLHLPVAPECNLGCNYCEKCIGGASYHTYRPAVAREILNPMEALHRVLQASKKTNKLSVAGIAGPGEPLANEATFITLELIKKYLPNIILCISTNGILLKERIQRLLALGFVSVSITINSFDLETIKKLYRYVIDERHKILEGKEAAVYIRKKQLEGLECMAENRIVFKVNTILMPGLNDSQIEDISRTIAGFGARLHNIVPFIPLGKLSYIARPGCDQLKAAREASGKHMKQFCHCRQCSSDAFDIPGKVRFACGNDIYV
jgi:nitrogen fixation protein NifB